MSLNIVFMGTPDFAVPALEALIASPHKVVAAYTQPPKPAGRGHKEQCTPVDLVATDHGISVHTPRSLKTLEEHEKLRALEADIAVVAAYGLILPSEILNIPRLGCLNIHASLLPRWRGAAPIQAAIAAGDAETGLTIMQMDEGLDTGEMLLTQSVDITPDETGQSLHDKLAVLGGPLIVEALKKLAAGTLNATPQDNEVATYATKLSKEEGRLDWQLPAVTLERRIRAFTPWPGSFFMHNGNSIKVLSAEVTESTEGEPGDVTEAPLTIACGESALKLTRLQRPGKTAMIAEDFIRGYAINVGERLS